jgi:hypothetical protein
MDSSGCFHTPCLELDDCLALPHSRKSFHFEILLFWRDKTFTYALFDLVETSSELAICDANSQSGLTVAILKLT